MFIMLGIWIRLRGFVSFAKFDSSIPFLPGLLPLYHTLSCTTLMSL